MSTEKPRVRVKARSDAYTDIVASVPRGNSSSGLNDPRLDRSALGGPSAASQHMPSFKDLFTLYLTNGLASRVVDLAVDDAFSRGFKFKGDTQDNFIEGEFKRLAAQNRFTTGQRWAELFGASAIIIYTDDNPNPAIPLDPENPGNIYHLRAVDITSINPFPSGVETDPTSPMFGLYAYYTVQAKHGGMQQIVHHSRIIKLHGADLPDMLVRGAPVPWMGKSVLIGAYEEIQRYENMNRWTERMFERKQQLIYMMEGLGAYLSEMRDEGGGGEGTRVVQERINMIDTVRSVLNTIVIDNGMVNAEGQTISKGDNIEAEDLNLSNVPQTLSIMQMNIASKSGYSVTVLFGRSASGLNSSGDRELESHYNRCEVVRDRCVHGLRYLTQLVLNQPAAKRKLNKKKQLKPTVEFGSLWLPSDLETAQANQANATANFNNANAIGVLLQSTLSPEAALTWMAEQGMFGITIEAIPNIMAYIKQKQAEALAATKQVPEKTPALNKNVEKT